MRIIPKHYAELIEQGDATLSTTTGGFKVVVKLTEQQAAEVKFLLEDRKTALEAEAARDYTSDISELEAKITALPEINVERAALEDL